MRRLSVQQLLLLVGIFLVVLRCCGDHVLLKEDALFVIPGAARRFLPTSDLDGDGRRDLVLARGRRAAWDLWPAFDRIEAVSSQNGQLISTYWRTDGSRNSIQDWDAGGDVDGDGCDDVVLGMPWASGAAGAECGRIEIRSGADGAILRISEGRASHDQFDYSVAFLGDVDGDGRADYAVGAPQLDPGTWTGDPRPTVSDAVSRTEDVRWSLEWISRLESRRGYVTVASGGSGVELYSVDGEQLGAGFGLRVVPTGDIDRDTVCDWIGQCLGSSSSSPRWVSGKAGTVVGALSRSKDSIARGGDIDADGHADILVDRLETLSRDGFGVQVLSGRTLEKIWQIPYPDWNTEFPTAVSLGDVDGDGDDDVGIGDGNFHVRGLSDFFRHGGDLWSVTRASTLRSMTFAEALSIQTQPRYSGSPESGCAVIYSGRTHDVIFGVFGDPGSSDGIGLTMAPLPDINGDGWPDVAIGGEDGIYVFAGPGG